MTIQHEILQSLASLQSRLGKYGQTTHGIICRPASVEYVLEAVADAYHEPSAYNISELSQRIAVLLDSEGVAGNNSTTCR